MEAFVGHYMPLKRQVNQAMIPYLYPISFVVAVACIIAYCIVDGKEQVLEFYIPLDFMLSLMKVSFYMYISYRDKWKN